VVKYLAGKYPHVRAVRFTNSVEKQDFKDGFGTLLFARFVPEYPCTVRDKRSTMNDEDFWADVFGQPSPFDEAVELDECFGISAPDPCPECGSSVACGYDSEGRPMMHIVERDE
jgi:hypothetical protein